MIEYAGLGIAMGNAIKKLKEKANYITDTNTNDGVRKALEKFVLRPILECRQMKGMPDGCPGYLTCP